MTELWLYTMGDDGFQRGKRLDPEQVVFRGFEVKPEHVGKTLLPTLVQDIIDALDQEEE